MLLTARFLTQEFHDNVVGILRGTIQSPHDMKLISLFQMGVQLFDISDMVVLEWVWCFVITDVILVFGNAIYELVYVISHLLRSPYICMYCGFIVPFHL